jgi:hypothetical protein
VNADKKELYGWRKCTAPGLTVLQRKLNPDSLAMYAACKSSLTSRAPFIPATFCLLSLWLPIPTQPWRTIHPFWIDRDALSKQAASHQTSDPESTQLTQSITPALTLPEVDPDYFLSSGIVRSRKDSVKAAEEHTGMPGSWID